MIGGEILVLVFLVSRIGIWRSSAVGRKLQCAFRCASPYFLKSTGDIKYYDLLN